MRSTALAEDRRHMRRDTMNDGGAPRSGDGRLNLFVAAPDDCAIRRLRERLAAAGAKDRIVLFIADYSKHAEAIRIQTRAAHRAERVDRIAFDAHRFRIDQLLRGEIGDELV